MADLAPLSLQARATRALQHHMHAHGHRRATHGLVQSSQDEAWRRPSASDAPPARPSCITDAIEDSFTLLISLAGRAGASGSLRPRCDGHQRPQEGLSDWCRGGRPRQDSPGKPVVRLLAAVRALDASCVRRPGSEARRILFLLKRRAELPGPGAAARLREGNAPRRGASARTGRASMDVSDENFTQAGSPLRRSRKGAPRKALSPSSPPDTVGESSRRLPGHGLHQLLTSRTNRARQVMLRR